MNRRNAIKLMAVGAASLGAVIAFNFLNSLLTALRMYRANSQMQLVQTLLYAAVSVGLLWSWQAGAESVVAAAPRTGVEIVWRMPPAGARTVALPAAEGRRGSVTVMVPARLTSRNRIRPHRRREARPPRRSDAGEA